jgi:exosome complex exonuclease DIS3/RRP44
MENLITFTPSRSDNKLHVSYKRTRRGKIRKHITEVYLRDDIPCGVHGCAACSEKDTISHTPTIDPNQHIIIFDAQTAISQTDFIISDVSVSNCLLCYSVLDSVQRVDRNKAEKLRELCKVSASAFPDQPGSRRFFAFPNEFHRDTFTPLALNEKNQTERDFMACVKVAQWIGSHSVANVRLVVSSSARAEQGRQMGLHAQTVWEYVDSVRELYPLAGECLSAEVETAKPDTEEFVYPAHLSSSEIAKGLQEGRFIQGNLRMAMGSCLRGTVGGLEISGKLDLNRAIDGDLVAVEESLSSSAKGMDFVGEFDDDALEADAEPDSAESHSAQIAERIMEISDNHSSTSMRRGRVVGVIQRNFKEYPGALCIKADDDEQRQDRIFVPCDSRIPFIRIRTRNVGPLIGKRLVVVIDSWDRTSKSPQGHWVAILGNAGDRDTESAVILREHQVITREFSDDVMACLPPNDFAPSAVEIAKRIDLRDIPVCSIDPPGCKDIDDALSCEPLPNGNFRVGVHIADVTYFVHPGTPIDREAAERCTTVYLVEKRTDMLPGLLTADLCSLREKVDRLCFSVLWEMTSSGEIVTTSFHKAIINSRAALTYAAAQAMVDDPSDHTELTVSIRNLNSIAKNIRIARMDRGGLELASQEVRFELDTETQDPTSVALYQSRDTNKLVEEFMILANQSVAKQVLSSFPSISVLRRHPPPKDQNLEELKILLEKQGFCDFKFGSNKELAESLSKISRSRDPFFNRLVKILATRCMNQAAYVCTGDFEPGSFWHYGLALDVYTHFTSPIRRYADILVHRLLAASLGISGLPEGLQTKTLTHNQCEIMNFKHKMAQLAGRASADLHIYMYFKKIGPQECDSIITRIRKTKREGIALHVLSINHGMEGVLTLPPGWIFDEETGVATAIDSGSRLTVFDHVIVRISADDKNFRFRTVFTFMRKSVDSDISNRAAASP